MHPHCFFLNSLDFKAYSIDTSEICLQTNACSVRWDNNTDLVCKAFEDLQMKSIM